MKYVTFWEYLNVFYVALYQVYKAFCWSVLVFSIVNQLLSITDIVVTLLLSVTARNYSLFILSSNPPFKDYLPHTSVVFIHDSFDCSASSKLLYDVAVTCLVSSFPRGFGAVFQPVELGRSLNKLETPTKSTQSWGGFYAFADAENSAKSLCK